MTDLCRVFVVSCQSFDDFLAPKHCIAQHKLDIRVIPQRISSMSLAEVDDRRPWVSLQDSQIFVALLHSSTITCLPTPMARPYSVASLHQNWADKTGISAR